MPWVPDCERSTEKPFNLLGWIKNHEHDLRKKGCVPLFNPETYQTDVIVHGFGDQDKAFKARTPNGETFFWVVQGDCTLKVDGEKIHLQTDETLLVPKNAWVEFQEMSSNSAVLSTTMDAKNRARVGFEDK